MPGKPEPPEFPDWNPGQGVMALVALPREGLIEIMVMGTCSMDDSPGTGEEDSAFGLVAQKQDGTVVIARSSFVIEYWTRPWDEALGRGAYKRTETRDVMHVIYVSPLGFETSGRLLRETPRGVFVEGISGEELFVPREDVRDYITEEEEDKDF